ncbi:MAG TPA: hypothetical protein VMT15_11255 [Bryobacteraceae bacterium]|nr:hypothetical protein [Bryobacteraceae bacterium]
MRFLLTFALAGLAGAQALPPDMPPLPPGFKMPPNMARPDNSRSKRGKRPGNDAGRVNPPGVPISMDSAPMKAFEALEQHGVYHMRITMVTPDPQMAQMLQMVGFAPTETTVANGAKQVIMRMKLASSDNPGPPDDWEFRSVTKDGKTASLMSSPAVPRLLAEMDAKFAKDMAQLNQMAARAAAQSAMSGPLGWISSGVLAASTALSDTMAVKMLKKAHEMFEWQCRAAPKTEPVDHSVPPPLTDLNMMGDQTVDGAAVTTYEFFIKDKDQFRGPAQIHILKDSGLPMRIELSDPQMRGASIRMDYYDFEKGDIEIPACIAKGQ